MYVVMVRQTERRRVSTDSSCVHPDLHFRSELVAPDQRVDGRVVVDESG